MHLNDLKDSFFRCFDVSSFSCGATRTDRKHEKMGMYTCMKGTNVEDEKNKSIKNICIKLISTCIS